MLRITIDGAKLVLQGQLAGPFVNELKSSWEGSLKYPESVVDLTDVTFIDEAGAVLLCSLKREGVKFIACGVDTKQLLNDLEKKTAPSLRRCLSWLKE